MEGTSVDLVTMEPASKEPETVTDSAKRLLRAARTEAARAVKAGEFRTKKLFDFIAEVALTSAREDVWSDTALFLEEDAFKYFRAEQKDRAPFLEGLWVSATRMAFRHNEDPCYYDEGDALVRMVLEVTHVEAPRTKRARVEEKE